ncbi:N,N-dimethylformamidase beta subunit family domain-containing protein [Actinokineospora enzanensis]|uniref:N,N-dimethylformamidase beta subunit family domain-containing protein n=1 Tax=Actinokineospora enzanensis TaxID=155975 RepID=UPI00035F414A|nr:N,N-dimethylformamidase beta subunit family domain-containing protein [Actinokineospora enzanensis]
MRHLHPPQTHPHTTAFAGAGATYTIALADSCVAGSRVVVVASGGAQPTIRFTNSSGTAFVRRAQALSALDVSIHDAVATGGESVLHVTLNGDENVVVTVYHTDAGEYVAGSAGTNGNIVAEVPTAVSVADPAVLFVGAAVQKNTAADEVLKLRQLGPLGRFYANGAHQPGSGTKLIYANGCADIDAAHCFPATLAAGQYKATTMWVNGGGDLVHIAQAAYADSTGIPSNPSPANPVVAENSLPGDLQSAWFGGVAATSATIAGYTDAVSYQPGDTVSFRVDSTGHPFRVELRRLGYYGWETIGARLVAPYITGTVASQPGPTVDPVLGSTSCAWSTNASWTIPVDACSGVYLATFRRTDDTTAYHQHHFVVRGDPAGRVPVVIADQTYQAYNVWGQTGDHGARFGAGTQWSGRSLYGYGPDTSEQYAHRGYAVSFDRPYSCASTQANTYLWDSDYPWLHWAEAQGLDLTYVSDVDLDKDTGLLLGARAVVVLGHHEYWTTRVYDAMRAVQAAGINMLINSSNTALWRVRYASDDTLRRTVICYKESLTRDGAPGWTGTGYDPVAWTGTWRDAGTANGRANPDIRRENALTGQLFRLSAPVAQRYGVPYASRAVPCWRNNSAVQALTSGQTWQAPAGTIGDEADAADGSTGQPANLANLCPTSISGTTGPNAAGTLYSTSVTITCGWTVHRTGAGGLVANSGSWRAGQGLTRWAQSTLGNVVTSSSVDWQSSWLALLWDLEIRAATPRSLRPGLDAAPVDPATGAPAGPRNRVAVAYGLSVPPTSGLLTFFLQGAR